MRYLAIITHEGNATLAEFPDFQGCQTFVREGDGRGTIEDNAREALEGWLESSLEDGEEIPWPSDKLHAKRGEEIVPIEISAKLAVQIVLRQARAHAKLTQAELAERAGISQQQVAKLEASDANPTVDTLERIAKALGANLEIRLTPKHA